MSEKMKVTNRFNKKAVMAAAAVLVLLLAAVLAITVPKHAAAGRLAEQLDLGEKFLSELDYEQAAVAYLKAIEIDPKCEDAYFALADIYIATGEFEKAEEILREAEKELGGTTERIEEKKKELERAKKRAEVTPEPTPMNTPVPTPTPTNMPEPTPTLTPEPTPTSTPMPEPTPTNTPMPTPTDVPVQETDASMFAYEENRDGTVTVTGFSEKGKAAKLTEILIPKMIEGKRVTEIGWGAFEHCDSLTSIKLPESVTEIGPGAFWDCSNMMRFEVAVENANYMSKDGVLYSKDGTILCEFVVTTGRREFTVPDGVIEIYTDAFGYCDSLTRIELPEGLKTIGMQAFFSCYGLESIIIPRSVTKIEERAFVYCNGLTGFEVVAENENYMSKDGVLYSKDGTVLWDCVVTAGRTEFIVPDGVMEIRDKAFESCQSLTSIKLPESVTEIGAGMFWDCSNLMRFEVAAENANYMSKDGVLYSKDGTVLWECVVKVGRAEFIVPDGVMEIYTDAFGCCDSLTRIELPEGLKVIGKQAFFSCGRLGSITVPKSVTEIGYRAFVYCNSLTDITLPDGITEIGYGAFWDCKNLTITAPSGSYAESYAIKNNIPVKNP